MSSDTCDTCTYNRGSDDFGTICAAVRRLPTPDPPHGPTTTHAPGATRDWLGRWGSTPAERITEGCPSYRVNVPTSVDVARWLSNGAMSEDNNGEER